MTRRLICWLVLAAAGVLAPAAAFAADQAPPPQRFGVRLVDVPVSEARNPRALRYIIDFLPTGTTIRRRVLVQNQERRTAHFTIYPDAATIAHGLFTGDAGATRSELTGWIRVRHPALTLAPHASAMDPVTIRVPPGATRGEHYGVIWVQQVARTRAATGVVVREIARVGIRIYLAVGRGGAPPTKFRITSISGHLTAGGQPYIRADVRDTGGRAVDLAGTARLTDGPGGTSAGPFQAQQVLTLAPRQSGDLTFEPGRDLPSGPWLARVTMVSGLDRVTAQAAIQFSGSAASPAWLTKAAVFAVAGLIAGPLALRRYRARRARRHRVPA